jgi:hypothetical protein
MGTTSATPSPLSSDCLVSSRFSPMAAITVRSVPTITWAFSPRLSIRRTIWLISASEAPFFMTTIMAMNS